MTGTLLILSCIALILTIAICVRYKMAGTTLAHELESLKQQNSKMRSDYDNLNAEKVLLDSKVKELSPYLKILDTESHIFELRRKAEENLKEQQDRALTKVKNEQIAVFNLTEKAKSEAESTIAKAKESARLIQEKSDKILADANNNARITIDLANQEAKKIAADALDARDKADSFEKTAIAMKNIIEGYGDQYIVPTYGLLDSLADDYSHTDAGNELKRSRDLVKAMIKNDMAATCEYVEINRRDTAIAFVLDAFNGKVDSILSSVKKDNFGTLEQKIRDSFQTVNFNGRAFREAKITELYLSARLDELKWACTVQALKEKDKEEQRRIREQIREEEKAARDYEKAMKEAQKDEETLSKAMQKVRKDLESANEHQRLKYEEKLNDLQQKLKAAEDKSKRALSMAQQTKSGYVYIISNVGSFGEDVLKIGLTRRLDPQDRIDELGDASVPFDFDVHAFISNDDAPALEKELHRKFSSHQVNRVNFRKEFFKVKISELRKLIEEMGISTHWTMTAEAKEYRESISLLKKNSDVA
ncbi:DUF4041 domain-containing protein [Bdellovibrio sp. HCB185ZH]|uniref:DUF4041 domain-containing protein n=1 Tax=Bdellovibrio sp. HCB185ZH TaxID=3394235 RepID=UPI0039A7320C